MGWGGSLVRAREMGRDGIGGGSAGRLRVEVVEVDERVKVVERVREGAGEGPSDS